MKPKTTPAKTDQWVAPRVRIVDAPGLKSNELLIAVDEQPGPPPWPTSGKPAKSERKQ